MEQFKRVKVVLLTTKKESKLAIIYDNLKDDGSSTILQSSSMQQPHINNGLGMFFTGWRKPLYQHLYIISDDEIKENDWYIYLKYNTIIQKKDALPLKDNCKKIIATIDTSLTINSYYEIEGNQQIQLPQPSQQFIEKYIESYNKGEVITDVLVEYENNYDLNYYTPPGGIECSEKIDNWKLKINTKDNTITIKKLKDSWDREEHVKNLKELGQHLIKCYQNGNGVFTHDIHKWIEENL